MTDQADLLAIVVHAHLPMIGCQKAKEDDPFEVLFFEWCTDVLLPLLDTLERLDQDQVSGPITLSLSSSIAAMLDDEHLRRRLERHLKQRVELCRRERKRTAKQLSLSSVADWHLGRLERLLRSFRKTYQRDLVGALKAFKRSGRLELITAVGSHPVVPLLSRQETMRAQVSLAVDDFTKRFGEPPVGMWLPECAYQPGIEDLFAAHGIRYTVVSARALAGADPPPVLGGSRPVAADSGLVFFARDEVAAREISDSATGFRGDSAFMDRRLSPDLEPDIEPQFEDNRGELQGLSLSIDWRANTLGFFGFPDSTGLRRSYDPDEAALRTAKMARAFLDSRRQELSQQHLANQSSPIAVFAADSQLFGRWWLEGSLFVDELVRQAATAEIALTTPSRYLDDCRLLQISQPATSSWGQRGFLKTWLDEDNAWIYRHLHSTEDRLLAAVSARRGTLDRQLSESLSQAARELLLAQTSNWAALVGHSRAASYAVNRIKDHLTAANSLLSSVETGQLDGNLTTERRNLWPIFSDLDPSVFDRV